MSTSPASNPDRPPRRSTRVNQVIPLTVMGVDSCRGPYREQVSTVTVSCHGCKYESKHEVLNNSLVILELKGEKQDSAPVSARGRVKWVKRSPDLGGIFQTAVELEDPGNIWGIDSPPKDWLPFCGPRNLEMDTSKPKPFAIPRPESPSAPPAHENLGSSNPHKAEPALSLGSADRPVSLLTSAFQQQMEKMLSDAAAAAIREKTGSAFEELRARLREEAKRILAETTASQTRPWIEQALKQMKQAGMESARTLHEQWNKKIEADIQKAIGRIEVRSQELDQLAQSLSANALERLQRSMDATRKDSVDRIVSRLKDQLAPLLDHAQKVAADLSGRKDQVEKILDQSLERFSARIEESCTRFEKQFEMILRERLDTAREELERACKQATIQALDSVRVSSQKYEAEAQARLQESLQPIAESALSTLKEKATETSRHFASELKKHSRSHLEYVSGAISELAKGLGKLSKD